MPIFREVCLRDLLGALVLRTKSKRACVEPRGTPGDNMPLQAHRAFQCREFGSQSTEWSANQKKPRGELDIVAGIGFPTRRALNPTP